MASRMFGGKIQETNLALSVVISEAVMYTRYISSSRRLRACSPFLFAHVFYDSTC